MTTHEPIAGSITVNPITIDPIGVVHSCFKEKFGIPRQPSLAPLAKAVIEILPPYNVPDAWEGIASSSHLWVHFVFHANKRLGQGHEQAGWKSKVKPPRLGGNQAMGVFATRSPVRPNALGLSAVVLDKVLTQFQGKKGMFLAVSAHDLLDGTPIIDIKPYVPYADSITGAHNAFAKEQPALMAVNFTDDVAQQLQTHGTLKALITQVLQQDPRPAYQKGSSAARIYGMKLEQWDVQWRYAFDETGCEFGVVTGVKALL